MPAPTGAVRRVPCAEARRTTGGTTPRRLHRYRRRQARKYLAFQATATGNPTSAPAMGARWMPGAQAGRSSSPRGRTLVRCRSHGRGSSPAATNQGGRLLGPLAIRRPGRRGPRVAPELGAWLAPAAARPSQGRRNRTGGRRPENCARALRPCGPGAAAKGQKPRRPGHDDVFHQPARRSPPNAPAVLCAGAAPPPVRVLPWARVVRRRRARRRGRADRAAHGRGRKIAGATLFSRGPARRKGTRWANGRRNLHERMFALLAAAGPAKGLLGSARASALPSTTSR